MRRACMLVHSYYPADPRVRREAEALLEEGWAVDVVCLRDDRERPLEWCAGARVRRLPVRRHRGSGLATYLLEYLAFLLLASVHVTWWHIRQRYDVVQVHNMPDFLVFAALGPRVLGARVVLDMHDLVPELYMLKFAGSDSHPTVRIAQWAERVSTDFAEHVITAGEPFRRLLVARGLGEGKVTVVMNSADPKLFCPVPERRAPPRQAGSFTLVYHGGLYERYGLDIAVSAVGLLRSEIPGIQLNIYGQGEASEQIGRLIEELGLVDCVNLAGFVPLDRVPELICTADLGVVPYRSNSFTDLLYPTKAFEYIVMGVPVIMSGAGAVTDLFVGVDDIFFQPEDVDDLATHILALYREPERLRRLLSAARRAYSPYAWESQKTKYLTLMGELVEIERAIPHPNPY